MTSVWVSGFGASTGVGCGVYRASSWPLLLLFLAGALQPGGTLQVLPRGRPLEV